MRILRVLLLLPLATAVVSGDSRPSREPQTAPVAPAWTRQDVTDDGRNLSIVGASRSASESQARQGAAAAAVDKGVSRVVAELIADPATATFYGVDALRKYVQRVSRVTNNWVAASTDGQYDAFALVVINKSFLRPAAVREYATAPVAATGQAIGYLLVPADLKATSISRRAQVRMATLRDGNFYFYFTIVKANNVMSTRFEQIQALSDGSAGQTRWSFDVTVGGRLMVRLPDAKYTDSIVTYPRSDRPFEYVWKPGEAVVEIRIVGSKREGLSK